MDLLSNDESDESDNEAITDEVESSFHSIVGHQKYSPEIRKLYYSLLVDQVPVSKIAEIIRTVLKCFNPSMNVEELKLPKKSCASYMRKEELKLISDVHKAHTICDTAMKGKGLYLNTDGTTKHQKKLGGIVANSMVLGVNELPDGTAASIIEDISKEFEKLRKVARVIGLENADSINWTLVKSSSSDSAATQSVLTNSSKKEEKMIKKSLVKQFAQER